MRALRFVGQLFERFPRLLVVNTLLLLAANLVDAASIFTVAPVADLVVHPDGRGVSRMTERFLHVLSRAGIPTRLEWLLLLFLILYTAMNAFQILARWHILRTKYFVERDIYLGSFDDFFGARWQFFTAGKQGTLLNTFLREVTVVGNAFNAVALFFAGCLQTALYLAVPLYLSWKITLICVGAAGIFALPFLLLGKVHYSLGKRNTTTGNEIGAVIAESFALAKVILGYGNQAESRAVLERVFNAHVDVTVKSQTLGVAIPLMYHPLGVLVLLVAFVSSSRLGVPLAETAVLLFALFKIVPALGQIAVQKGSLDNFFPSFEHIQELRERARALRQPSGTHLFSQLRDALTLEDVTFAYPGHPPALRGVTARVPKGRMVAFVGESGAGKSTLVDMLMGFNEPTQGRVLCDGVPLAELDILSYRKRLGYVPQDSVLFNGTICDNLLWSKPDATAAELEAACRQANAHEFIERLPLRYETEVGDRGVRLSGGQIQRVALARAILRQPQLLILDEATSSLDTQSERLIQQAIEAIARQTTTVVIAHRLSTIVNADYIYVLDNGRVIEEGSYQDLLRLRGRFSRMVSLQKLEPVPGEKS